MTARRRLIGPALVGLFVLLATLNAGGYRFGVGDQAFYLPMILDTIHPELFPRDSAMLHAQGGLLLFDEIAAGVVDGTGATLSHLFLGLYLAGLLGLAAALIAIGRTFYASWWTVLALLAAATLRHRIPETGVNTLEGYLHPRMLAFAIGAAAVAAVLRERWRLALVLPLAAALMHPTIGIAFFAWAAVAVSLEHPPARRWIALLALAAAVAGGAVVLAGGDRLSRMDAAWVAVVAGKDYLFPTEWPAWAWLLNLAYPAALVAVYWYRRRHGATRPGELGMVGGGLALVAAFLVSVPLVAWRIALAVQLQVTRVFWVLDLLVLVYLVWLAAEGLAGTRRRAMIAGLVLLAAAAGRGAYVMAVEHPERGVFEVNLQRGPWTRVLDWMARQPPDTHFLVDPGHAWRFGVSARVGAQRDVYLEEQKDTAMAIYDEAVAERVLERIQDLGDFARLTAPHARALAREYDLDYLVSDRTMPLPVVAREGTFIVYRLADGGSGEP